VRKLAAAREALLGAGLGLQPARLLTFAEQGSVQAARGPRNRHFSLTYQAHLIVTDWSGDPRALLWVLLSWLQADSPAASDDAIAFHVDIIDHQRSDVAMRVELTETVRVVETDAGIAISHEPDPDAQAIDMGALFPDMPTDGG
jgi:hypothetical protein